MNVFHTDVRTKDKEGRNYMKVITINEQGFFSLPLAYATESEIREFCGEYLTHIRRQDHVLGLRLSLETTQTDEYAAPWRGDILVKPVHELNSPLMVIRGDCTWAKHLFGGENARETSPAVGGEGTGLVDRD